MPYKAQLEVKENQKLSKSELKLFASQLVNQYRSGQPVTYQTNGDKLTPKLEKQIIKLVARTGLNNRDAAKACGISEATYQNWKRWGKFEAQRISEALNNGVKELTEQGMLNPNDSTELELFVTEYIKKLKPNKFYRFFCKLEEEKAKVLGKQLENIKRAGKGGKYLTEKIVHKDKNGKIKRTETKSRYSVPQWGASAWILERLRPDIYSETKKVQSTMDIQGEVNHNVKIDMESSKAAQMLEILLNSDYMALTDNTAKDAIDGEIVD